MSLREQIRPLLERIDALSLRERAIVLVTALAVVYIAWDAAVFESLYRERSELERAIEETRLLVDQLNDQTSTLAAQRGVDPNVAERRAVESLRAELATVNQALVEATHHLVPPEEMARLLEAVLTQETKLELLHLEGLGAEPLVLAESSSEAPGQAGAKPDAPAPLAVEGQSLESSADDAGGLYRHGLRIEFRGSYLETLKYLAALERLSWSFLWESVRYRVESYPRARVSITVHSLSFDDAWIGV